MSYNHVEMVLLLQFQELAMFILKCTSHCPVHLQENFNHHQPPMNHLQLLQILHIQYCTPIQTHNQFLQTSSASDTSPARDTLALGTSPSRLAVSLSPTKDCEYIYQTPPFPKILDPPVY